MGEDMPSDWFLRVSVGHCVPWICHHLVRHVDGNVELLGKLDQLIQHLAQDLLPLRQLPSPGVVCSEASHDRVKYHKGCGAVDHQGSCDIQELIHMLNSVPPSILDILQCGFGIQTEPLSDFHDSLRSTKLPNSYNVPQVSMQITLPFPPPFSRGSWDVTQRVCASWVFPVLNSPKASVIAMDSIPPPSARSRAGDPVVIFTMFFLFSTNSFPEMKLAFYIFLAIS